MSGLSDKQVRGPGVEAGEKRYFGRRKGRPLTAQRLALMEARLPGLRLDLGAPAPADLRTLFPTSVDEVWLEIGFGGGEHLAAQALRHPGVGFIGAEPFLNGVAKLVSLVEAHGLANVRIHDDDARPLLAWLPEASLSRAFILFPDPWPKRRHADRRVVSPETAAALARAMKRGGRLRLASDVPDYLARAQNVIAAGGGFALSPQDKHASPADWATTRYEAKAIAAGRACVYLEFIREPSAPEPR
jgi:tRNA (guanine-N7-)-methyltransferase